MPSSISSSDAVALRDELRPGFVRLTASDRPGVAQPVPVREIPQRPWGGIWIGAAILALALLALWEWHWRDFGVRPSWRNSDGSWAEQRRRIDEGEGGKTVLIGSSRVLFDVQLPVWQQIAGDRPIQLALEGTSSVPVLEDLADDPKFTGRLLVGVAPELFFSGFAYRGKALAFFHKQSPSQRIGHWISQHFIEPYLAFDDPDFALAAVVRRQDWPLRPGMHPSHAVRKLAVSDADRNTHMWDKVEDDPAYREVARSIWTEHLTGKPPPNMDTPEKLQKTIAEQIDRAVKAVAKLRARGVRIVFVRPPSTDFYLQWETKVMPREKTWDVLLRKTGAPGIHFQDYPQLQGFEQPEWSHIKTADARKFTAALTPLVLREFEKQETGAAAKPSVAR